MARQKQVAKKNSTVAKMIIVKGEDGPAEKKERKKRRYRSGTVALREIRKFQRDTSMLIPKAPFRRLVREIGQAFKAELRFSSATFDAIQSMAEAHLIKVLRSTNKVAIHAKRVGITSRDMEFAISQAAARDEE